MYSTNFLPMKHLIVFICILFFSTKIPHAQNLSKEEYEGNCDILQKLNTPSRTGGYAKISGLPETLEILKIHKDNNIRKGRFQGYRIQIYSENSSRSDMEELRKKCEEFNEFFPDIPVYLEYYDPDFKIRAGNFETKIESIPSLKRIRTKYPSAYSIKTDIKMDVFLRPKEIRDSTESTNFYDNSTTAGQ